jgi:hypothetical protein
MHKIGLIASKSALTSLFVCGVISAATLGSDLSQYRSIQFGTDLPAVAKQIGVNPSEAKAIHRRPALIQELEWRPQPFGPSSQTESAQYLVFSFYNGALFQIAVNYDRYKTAGLTADDFIEALSATYGVAEKPAAPGNIAQGEFGTQGEIVARWQDSQYSFDLIRSSYGPTFRLVGVLKRLQSPVQAATTEAKRLDDQEAPQRDAARLADEKETERARLEKSRLENKPNFRP